MRRSVQVKGAAILVLLLATLCIWYAALREDHRGLLTVSFLDVGQGDSIFIQAPSGRQVLIDGGPDSSVLRQLGRVMPWYDHSIDVLVATHPDADHISGLIDVLGRYDVGMVVRSSAQGSTALSQTFTDTVETENARILDARRGQVIELGGGARLEILFPDRNVARVETNIGCIVARLVYGTTSFMLSCDTTSEVERYLVQMDGVNLKSDVLKAAHHGSKTSSSALFLGYVHPEYGMYSRGCENSYGHPAQQTIDTFARFEIPTLDTCEEGTITFVSDGKTVVRK